MPTRTPSRQDFAAVHLAPAARDVPGHGYVLVVDTDKHVRELLREFLGRAGLEVAFADDGVSALANVKARPPALVITEILLPKLDGLALCRAIKHAGATKAIPVLVLSILASGQRASEAGADGFSMKPLEERPLLQIVERLLGESRRVERSLQECQ